MPHEVSSEQDPIVHLGGLFAHFLSTVNVDRPEPTFKISPRGRDVIGHKSAMLDVVIVRPFRDPTIAMESEEVRATFAAKVGAGLGGAYQDGAHIGLWYGDEGRSSRTASSLALPLWDTFAAVAGSGNR